MNHTYSLLLSFYEIRMILFAFFDFFFKKQILMYFCKKMLVMKRVLFFLAFVFVAAVFQSCEKEEEFDESLLIGKWQETGLRPFHYRYDPDRTGVRWKPDDHVEEEEGEKFTWQLVKSELERIHIRIIDGGRQPEVFTVIELTATSLKYKNESRTYSFTKY